MRIVLIMALCAIHTCHMATSRTRQKRTLRMLGGLMDQMRETFGPTPAQRSTLSSQPDVVLTSKYPSLGVKYMYYPTVRMHIRPVQPSITKHIIYVKPVPVPPPLLTPIIRPIAPMPKANVEIVKRIRPMVRLPKTKTTTTITYEIIPLPIPMQPAPTILEQEEEISQIPWSIDALPPPVPTTKLKNTAEEQNVPWNLQALPPPVATKRPRMQMESEWYLQQATPDTNTAYPIPVANKKFFIPKYNRKKLHYGHATPSVKAFRSSTLQSEISVQPSIEVVSYTEIESANHHSRREYFNRLNDRRPQTFEDGKERFRRDLQSFKPPYQTSVSHYLNEVKREKGEQNEPFETQTSGAGFGASRSNTFARVTDNAGFNFNELTNIDQTDKLPSPHEDNGEYEDARGEYSERSVFDSNLTNSLVTIVKAADWPVEVTTALDHSQYVAITPKPFNYVSSSIAMNSPIKLEPAFYREGQSRTYPTFSQYSKKSKFDGNGGDFSGRRQRQRLRISSTGFLHPTKSTLAFPDTGFLSKFPRRHNDDYGDTVSDLFSEQKSTGKFANTHESDRHGFDFENIEYFEPIVIDIEKEKQRSDIDSKLKFKYKNLNKENGDEPLKLPDSLHETIDYLQKTLIHPPIFDLEGEADVLRIVAVVDGANGIT